MKITIQIEVTTDDHSTPLFEDVERELRERLGGTNLRWADHSLDRWVGGKINVGEIRQG